MWTLAGLEIFRNILHLSSEYFFFFFFFNELLTQLPSYLALVPPSLLPPHSGKKSARKLVSES